jgi:hypothetical protein
MAWVRMGLPRLESSRWLLPAQVTWWCAAAWLLFLFSRQSQADFLYFQF